MKHPHQIATQEVAAMTDQQTEYLTALLFARPEISAQMNAQMHIATDRKVRLVTLLPLFDLPKAVEILLAMKPQVVIIDAHVDGFELSQIIHLRQKAAEPFVVVGLAQAGSTEMEQLLGYNLDATYTFPLNPHLYDRFDQDLPAKYEQVSQAWGKGVWGAGAPEAIKAATAAAGASSWQRSAIAVYSPKGGVGKTVIACELAATLAALGGREVALIDANMNGGHVKLRLNVDVPHGILNAAATYHTNKGHPSLEADALKKVLGYLVPLAGTSNLKVLPGVVNMEQSLNESLLGEAGMDFMIWLIPTLKRQFDFVVIDMGSSINVGTHIGVLKSVDFIIAVCEPDLTSLADIKEAIHRSIVAKYGVGHDRVGLVINKWQDNLGISLKEASKYAEVTAMGIIANDGTGNITRAGNQSQSYFAKYINEKKNPKETEQTLHGFAQLAGQFYSPISAAWSERLKSERKKNRWR